MEMKLIEIKAAIAAAFTAIGIFLGWKGIMAVVWVCAMCLDYISGTAAALKSGEWSSAVAREGLWHKFGMILVVIVSFISDYIILSIMQNIPDVDLTWPCPIFPLVLAWYILTELGSVLENAVKMGAAVPTWVTSMLSVSVKVINNKIPTQKD